MLHFPLFTLTLLGTSCWFIKLQKVAWDAIRLELGQVWFRLRQLLQDAQALIKASPIIKTLESQGVCSHMYAFLSKATSLELQLVPKK